MGRRGSSHFRHSDGLRALRIAKDGGLEPTAIEVVVGTDGAVVFRVLTERAASLMGVAPTDAAGAQEWQDEIAKLKGKAPKTKGRRQS
jgi:hypothetical protein